MAAKNVYSRRGPKNKAVLTAIQLLGGVRAAARRFRVSHSTVAHWIYRAVPAERAVALATATGISAAAMRPDLYPEAPVCGSKEEKGSTKKERDPIS